MEYGRLVTERNMEGPFGTVGTVRLYQQAVEMPWVVTWQLAGVKQPEIRQAVFLNRNAADQLVDSIAMTMEG